MSHQSDREEFVAIMAQEGVPVFVSRAVMRASATLHRLAEAQCNGDWPADNGVRPVKQCEACEGWWAPSVLKRRAYMTEGRGGRTYYRQECPDCRTRERVRAILTPYNIIPVFSGDPRGAVVKLKVPSGKTNDWGQTGVCVP